MGIKKIMNANGSIQRPMHTECSRDAGRGRGVSDPSGDPGNVPSLPWASVAPSIYYLWVLLVAHSGWAGGPERPTHLSEMRLAG